jgi:hypothetical protein
LGPVAVTVVVADVDFLSDKAAWFGQRQKGLYIYIYVYFGHSVSSVITQYVTDQQLL